MREVRITCLAIRYLIQDLGLVLTKGQERILSEDAADKSKDLAQARVSGAVSVEVIERCREERPPGPAVAAPRVPLAPTVEAPQPLNLATVRELVEDAVRRQVLAMRQEIFEELASKQAPPPQKGKVVKGPRKRKAPEGES